MFHNPFIGSFRHCLGYLSRGHFQAINHRLWFLAWLVPIPGHLAYLDELIRKQNARVRYQFRYWFALAAMEASVGRLRRSNSSRNVIPVFGPGTTGPSKPGSGAVRAVASGSVLVHPP
jgi:hypothetical protein